VCILEIDINGAKKLYEKGLKANYIGILPPSMESLRDRLKNRKTENTDQIAKRLELSQEEITEINASPFFSHRIINDDFETGLKDFTNAILSLYPHLKTSTNPSQD
jgi:guanylate kinase